MRYAAIGLLAALLGVGCALQPADPGDEPSTTTTQEPSHVQADMAVLEGVTGGGTSKGNPGINPKNPQPAPWDPQQNPAAATISSPVAGSSTGGQGLGDVGGTSMDPARAPSGMIGTQHDLEGSVR